MTACLYLMAEDSKVFIETLKESLEEQDLNITFGLITDFNSYHGKRTAITFNYTKDNLALILSEFDDAIKNRLGIQLLQQ